MCPGEMKANILYLYIIYIYFRVSEESTEVLLPHHDITAVS